ncbi:unnamed protein product [Urochloa humidicola]
MSLIGTVGGMCLCCVQNVVQLVGFIGTRVVAWQGAIFLIPVAGKWDCQRSLAGFLQCSFGNVPFDRCNCNKGKEYVLWIQWEIPWSLSLLLCWSSNALATLAVITSAHLLCQFYSSRCELVQFEICVAGVQTLVLELFISWAGVNVLSNVNTWISVWKFHTQLVKLHGGIIGSYVDGTTKLSDLNTLLYLHYTSCNRNNNTGQGLPMVLIRHAGIYDVHKSGHLWIPAKLTRPMAYYWRCLEYMFAPSIGGILVEYNSLSMGYLPTDPRHLKDGWFSNALVAKRLLIYMMDQFWTFRRNVLFQFSSISYHRTEVQAIERLYPLTVIEYWFRSQGFQNVTSIKYLQVPWDPGGINLIHRLGGKPIFKKGGMLVIHGGPTAVWAMGLSAVHQREYKEKGARGRRHQEIIYQNQNSSCFCSSSSLLLFLPNSHVL